MSKFKGGSLYKRSRVEGCQYIPDGEPGGWYYLQLFIGDERVRVSLHTQSRRVAERMRSMAAKIPERDRVAYLEWLALQEKTRLARQKFRKK